MYSEVNKNHFVFRTAAGEVILEFDTGLQAPQAGRVIHLPSLSDKEQLIPYRITEVEFAPQGPENITIYIEVQPD